MIDPKKPDIDTMLKDAQLVPVNGKSLVPLASFVPKLAHDDDNREAIPLEDIVVPDMFYDRILTGYQVVNVMFGGEDMPGLMPGSATLFTGHPGAGKTTMSLQLAADLVDQGYEVIYNIGEENRYMVKLTASRLRLGQSKLRLTFFQDVESLCKFAVANGVDVVFADSLQSFGPGRYPNLSGTRLIKHIAKKLIQIAKENGITIVLIGHITKSGKFAGPQDLVHDLDAHAELKLNKETGNRILELDKNRFGPANIPYELTLSSEGLNFQQAKLDMVGAGNPGTGKPVRAKDRKELAERICRKIMLGEDGWTKRIVTGYTMSDPDVAKEVDVSGGVWRVLSDKVASALMSEGHKVVQKSVGGRGGWWVEV